MRRNIRLVMVLLVLLAIFHVPAFVTPFAHTAVFWLAYAATLIAFAMAAFTVFRVFRESKGLENTVMRWRIYRKGCEILVFQSAVFFVLAALSRVCPVALAAVVEVLILLFSALHILTRDTAANVITVSEARVDERIETMRRLRTRADALVKNNVDPALRAPLKRLSDALHYADPMGSKATADIEARIEQAIETVADAGSVDEIIAMVNERQALCRVEKNSRA